jgi:hypothetical protein
MFRAMFHRASSRAKRFRAPAQTCDHRVEKEKAMRKSVLVLVPLCFIALPALAGNQCTQQTTRGSWQYTCDGYLVPPPPAPAELVPSRILGTCTASRMAYWNCEGTVNLGGTILEQALHGQANNNDNCTGTITYTQTIFGQPAPDLKIQYVISDNGDTIKGLPISPNQVLSCLLNRTSNSDGH